MSTYYQRFRPLETFYHHKQSLGRWTLFSKRKILLIMLWTFLSNLYTGLWKCGSFKTQPDRPAPQPVLHSFSHLGFLADVYAWSWWSRPHPLALLYAWAGPLQKSSLLHFPQNLHLSHSSHLMRRGKKMTLSCPFKLQNSRKYTA